MGCTGSAIWFSIAAEASHVSPHARSLFRFPGCNEARDAPRTRLIARSDVTAERSIGLQDVGGVPVGLDLRPGVRDPSLVVDEEARADDPHVLPAVVLLERPCPVRLGHLVAL